MGGQKLSWSTGGLVDLRHLIPGSGGDLNSCQSSGVDGLRREEEKKKKGKGKGRGGGAAVGCGSSGSVVVGAVMSGSLVGVGGRVGGGGVGLVVAGFGARVRGVGL